MSTQIRKSPFVVSVADTDAQVVQSLGELLERCANQALQHAKTFRIGLSGGSLVQLLTRAIVLSKVNASQWKFYFCDERYVSHDNAESTYGAYRAELLTELPSILANQFVVANTSLPLDECASDYEERIKSDFATDMPIFDLLLLGMGPDGHTCSLFPEQPESLTESQRLVIPIRNSPKPPPTRITFTLPLINNAKEVAFVITGAGKADVVERVFLKLDKKLPAAWIEPSHGQLTLIADMAAGKALASQSQCCTQSSCS